VCQQLKFAEPTNFLVHEIETSSLRLHETKRAFQTDAFEFSWNLGLDVSQLSLCSSKWRYIDWTWQGLQRIVKLQESGFQEVQDALHSTVAVHMHCLKPVTDCFHIKGLSMDKEILICSCNMPHFLPRSWNPIYFYCVDVILTRHRFSSNTRRKLVC